MNPLSERVSWFLGGIAVTAAVGIALLGALGEANVFDTIGLLCSLVIAFGVAIVAYTYWASIARHGAQSQRNRSASFLNAAIRVLDRADATFTDGGALGQPPKADRVLWMTVARLLTEFRALGDEVTEEDHQAMLEDHAHYVRNRFRAVADGSKDLLDPRYFISEADPVDRTSIAVLLDFIRSPNGKSGGLSGVTGKALVAQGVVPADSRGIREYLAQEDGYEEALRKGNEAMSLASSPATSA